MSKEQFKTVELDFPIDVDGKQVAQLKMRRPVVKDMRMSAAKAKTEEEKELALVADLAGIPPTSLDAMDWADYQKLQEAFADFLS